MRAGWQTKCLGDYAAVSTGPFGSILHKSDYVDDGVPLVNPTNIVGDTIVPDTSKLISDETIKRLSNYVLDEGDVVIGRRGEIGRCAVVGPSEKGWVCGTGSFFVRPSPNLDSQFLAHLIRSPEYRERLENLSTGTTMKNLSNTALGGLSISVPALHEQHRIVAILNDAFDAIATAKANAEKNLQNARALFESHLQAVFTDAWETGELVTLAELATDITDGDHMPPPKATSGVPFITIGNVAKDSRTIDFSDTFKVPREYFDSLKPHKKPRTGDVLYTVTGSFGIPVLVKEQRDFCFQRHIGLIRPKHDVRSEWLNYLLMSPQIVQQANDGATGTAQKTVSLKVLRSFEVPRLPLAAQEIATTKLNSLASETQRLESRYRQKLAALDELKKSLLHQAFSGQL